MARYKGTQPMLKLNYETGLRRCVVNALIVLTAICLILLVLFHFIWQEISDNNVVIVLVASGLGFGFYTLLTMRRFLVKRL